MPEHAHGHGGTAPHVAPGHGHGGTAPHDAPGPGHGGTAPHDAPGPGHGGTAPHDDDARSWWEDRYAGVDGVWSGRVNAVLAAVVPSLPGAGRRALDLGCGEGGDVVWLAQQGWDATGVDLSATAVARAGAAAEAALAAGPGRASFVAADLAMWEPDGERYDLVTASFLQSWPVVIPRAEILRRATGFVAPGGHLLVTAHAAPPREHMTDDLRGYRFPSPEEDLAALDLDDTWTVRTAELRPRTAAMPDGGVHEVVDSVVLVRRG